MIRYQLKWIKRCLQARFPGRRICFYFNYNHDDYYYSYNVFGLPQFGELVVKKQTWTIYYKPGHEVGPYGIIPYAKIREWRRTIEKQARGKIPISA